MSKLTKREIFLINFLLLIGVVGAGYFMWIAPLSSEIKTLKNTRDTLKLEETKVNYLLSNKDSIATKYEDAKNEFYNLSSEFSQDVTNLDILTLVKKSGLDLVSLTRSETIINKISIKNAETTLYDYDLNTLINVIEQIQPEELITVESENDFAYQEITVVIEGSLAQGESFVNALNTNIKTGYVTLFNRNSKSVMTVTIGIYTMQPIQSDY